MHRTRSDCATSTGSSWHPTQKPEALLHRVLLASTAPSDIVLDPFAGTGTTAAVAKRLGRHFIAIERHPAYAEAAIGRVRHTNALPDDGLATTKSRQETPRVSFGSFVERGLVPPGTTLHDRLRRGLGDSSRPTAASSRGNTRGSIDKVGAAVQNAPSCNGWTFWHFERDGRLMPLDTLRDHVG